MKKRFIFDFDGVLADSLNITMININYLSNHGFDKIPLVNGQNDMNSLFNVKLSDSLSKYGYSQTQTKDFFNLHTALMCRDAEKICGFSEILNYIRNSNCSASIVSSSYSTYMNNILNRDSKYNLKRFDDILGREEHKSKASKIDTILSKYNIDKRNIIYIGDTVSDIIICKEIGVEVIAVGYGFQSRGYLIEFKPDYYVDNQSELIKLLNLLH